MVKEQEWGLGGADTKGRTDNTRKISVKSNENVGNK